MNPMHNINQITNPMLTSQDVEDDKRRTRRRRRQRPQAGHSTGTPTFLITTKAFSAWTLCLWIIVLLTLSSASSFRPFLGADAKPATKRRRHRPTYDKSKDNRALQSSIAIEAPRTTTWTDILPASIGKGTARSPYQQNIRKTGKYRIEKTKSNLTPQEKEEQLYQQRKAEWANRYTNLDQLRATFGANRNKVWGDLDATMTRRLYKTLLPKALLELVKITQERGSGDSMDEDLCAMPGVAPEELAPLAYQARVAAKLYARERCHVPARIAANFFDGYRQFVKYGKFQPTGMSYDQIWEKYHQQVSLEDDDEDDITTKICTRIIEKSCQSNEMVDKLCLSSEEAKLDPYHKEYLQWMEEQLEEDVRNLLLDPTPSISSKSSSVGLKQPSQDGDLELFSNDSLNTLCGAV